MLTNVTRAELEACARLLGRPMMLGRVQLCGCIVCTCDDDVQCRGCGAKNCGTHPVGAIPNPNYEPNPEDFLELARAAKLAIDYDADEVTIPVTLWSKANTISYWWSEDGTEAECIIKAAASVQLEREKQQ